MEVAYASLNTTPIGELAARETEDSRKKEQQTQAASLSDTVMISDEAREKQRAEASGESQDAKSGPDEGGREDGRESEADGYATLNKSAAEGGAGASGESPESPQTESEKLQRQIREVQKQITDASNRLAAAQNAASTKASAKPEPTRDAAADEETAKGASFGSATPAMPGAALAEGQAEVEAIQAELSQLNEQLMRLNQQLQEAAQGKGGRQPTGMRTHVSGLYSGSGGGAANVTVGGGHIG